MRAFDVVVIGSGPGGYVAAIRTAQLGLKTAIIEKEKTLGGTCLNVGCIPSKALLDSSEHYYQAKKTFKEHGITIDSIGLDMPQMIKRKNAVVSQTVKGVEFLMNKNKIEVIHGYGSFVDAHTINISNNGESVEHIKADKIIIATGSIPNTPASLGYDGKRIITSTEALDIDALPEKMVIIGGGVIGLELGSVFGRLGTQVDVVEYMDRIIAGMDKDCSKELMRSLKKVGLKFHLKHMVTAVKATDEKVIVTVQKRDSEDTFELEADYCLVAIGRVAFTDKLGLEKIGLNTDDKGRISVNANLQTDLPHIYAIGDVIRGAMLAHKAEEEGIFAAEHMVGQHPHIDYNLIPGVVYTWPEVAAVGKTEQELKESGKAYKVGKFPFKASARARASMDTEGMIKVLSDAETDEILGVHMVGPRVADIIAEAVVAMEYRASAEDIARMSHAHPTFTEAVKEAALMATEDRALHI